MKKVIEKYKSVIVQIATPYSTGTGFYLKAEGIVVTNEHVVQGNREVVVEGMKFERQLSQVIFTDPRYGNRDSMEMKIEGVYYFPRNGKKTQRVCDDLVRPNGLIL